MAVCHTENSNKFFQRPACVREPGGRKNQLSAPKEERATLEVTCSELAVLHFVRIFHTSRRQLLACGMRPSRALHSWRKGCLNFSHRDIPLKAWSISFHAQGKRSCLYFKTQKVSAQQNPLFSQCSITTPSWRTISLERQDSVNSGKTAPTLNGELRIPGVPTGTPPGQPGRACCRAWVYYSGWCRLTWAFTHSHWRTELELPQLLYLWDVHTGLTNQHTVLHMVTSELVTLDQVKISSHSWHCCT